MLILIPNNQNEFVDMCRYKGSFQGILMWHSMLKFEFEKIMNLMEKIMDLMEEIMEDRVMCHHWLRNMWVKGENSGSTFMRLLSQFFYKQEYLLHSKRRTLRALYPIDDGIKLHLTYIFIMQFQKQFSIMQFQIEVILMQYMEWLVTLFLGELSSLQKEQRNMLFHIRSYFI